jgi:dipeptidase D
MNVKTKEIINIFKQISAIPRCSKHEQKISQWLADWAENNGYKAKRDIAGNINIMVPPSPGYEHSPTIVFQGHMDMVCEKTPDAQHDFASDPIRLVYDGDWLKADQTTLGADNGIAIAMGLSLARDQAVLHPPLELLFTVDEETGLTGANKLEPGFVTGKILLNVDSEEEGVFTMGCAGGKDTRIVLAIDRAEIPESFQPYQVRVCGMRGGHSGVDIHKHRANAITQLARGLNLLKQAMDLRLVSIAGGNAHNAIPREAFAVFACNPVEFTRLQKTIAQFEQTVKHEYARQEPALAISVGEAALSAENGLALGREDTARVIDLLVALPHGVAGMSPSVESLVETSSNLATVAITEKALQVTTSQRSSVMTRLDEITGKIESTARLAGAVTKNENSYPAWQPDPDSALLKRCLAIYQGLFGRKPAVEIIHAGLECGIIGAKYPGMEMISFGPTLENPHSPDERLYLPSIAAVWDFVVALLRSYAEA